MANLFVFVNSVSAGNATVEDRSTSIQLTGTAQCERAIDQGDWIIEVPFTSTADEINKACVSAAIASVVSRGHAVGPEDTKRLFGGALANLS